MPTQLVVAAIKVLLHPPIQTDSITMLFFMVRPNPLTGFVFLLGYVGAVKATNSCTKQERAEGY